MLEKELNRSELEELYCELAGIKMRDVESRKIIKEWPDKWMGTKFEYIYKNF